MDFIPVWYGKLSRIVQPECFLYKQNIIGPLFILIDYYPYLITIVLFCLTLYQNEFVFTFLGIALSVDLYANWFSRSVVFASIAPRIAGCGDTNEFPSLPIQHAVFFILMLNHIFMRRDARTPWMKITFVYLFTLFSMIAPVYIGINTILEIYVATIEAFLLAIPMCKAFDFALFHKKKIINYSERKAGGLFRLYDNLME